MPFIEIEEERFPPNDDPDPVAIMRLLAEAEADEDRRIAWGQAIAYDAVAARLHGEPWHVIEYALDDLVRFALRVADEEAMSAHCDDTGPIVSSADVAIALVRWAQKNGWWQ